MNNLANIPQSEKDSMREHQVECIARDKEARAWLKRPRNEIKAHLDRTGDEKLRATLNLLQGLRGKK